MIWVFLNIKMRRIMLTELKVWSTKRQPKTMTKLSKRRESKMTWISFVKT